MKISKHVVITFMLSVFVLVALNSFLEFKKNEEVQLIQQPIGYKAHEYPQEYCLAQNIYFEARGSTLADRAAVADVTLNRVDHDKFPKTICGVVKQAKTDQHGNPVKNKCQFSWYCDGKKKTIRDAQAWAEAQALAWNIIHNKSYRGISSGATHYHTTYVRPYWSKKFNLIGQIGAHQYYRLPA